MAEKQLPKSIESEKAVIIRALLDQGAIADAADMIGPTDFSAPKHQHIWAALLRMVDAGVPVDLPSLVGQLEKDRTLDQVSAAYVAAMIDEYPMAVDMVHNAKAVREKSIIRQTLAAGQEIANQAWTATDAGALLSAAEEKILSIHGRQKSRIERIGVLMDRFVDVLEDRSKRASKITGLATGFSGIDDMTAGLQASDLIILAARPSMGKSALAWQIAANSARTGVPWAFFSLEMSGESLMARNLASEATVPANHLRTGYINREDWERINRAHDRVETWPIWIDDTPGLTPIEMRARARRLARDQNIKGIVVDYLQLMGSATAKYERRDLEIGDISRSLKAMAMELKVPVVALSQLNRKLEDRNDKRPKLSDLRESGALEQDADLVLFIYRDEVYNKDEHNPNRGKAEVILAKQRNGPTGTIPLLFWDRYIKFGNPVEGVV